MMSDAARNGYMSSGGDVDAALAHSQSAHDNAVNAWGSERDYVEAHGAFGRRHQSEVSGERSMVSVTTDRDIAEHFAGKDGVVMRADVPRDSLVAADAGNVERVRVPRAKLDPDAAGRSQVNRSTIDGYARHLLLCR